MTPRRLIQAYAISAFIWPGVAIGLVVWLFFLASMNVPVETTPPVSSTQK